MAYYLAKTDPDTYSIDHLDREKQTVWDGVTNPQAVRAIGAMRPGDVVFIYHSGSTSAGSKSAGSISGIVGLAAVRSAGRPDPRNPKSAVVDLAFLGRLDPPTSLADVKQSGLFADWALVRQGRLSTMAAPEEFVKWMRARYPNRKI